MKKGFTLVELLVVIAIIGLLATVAVVALGSARGKARDAKRVADVKNIQTSLEQYYSDQGGYPVEAVAVTLGATAKAALCTAGFGTSPCAGTTYMGLIPAAPTPFDGTCTALNNIYGYTAAVNTTYSLTFCLGSAIGQLAAGVRTASPSGMQ